MDNEALARLGACARVFVPDIAMSSTGGAAWGEGFVGDVCEALARTTDLCFSAHQDDIEFMAYPAISECFRRDDRWFAACVVTDGAGSPRSGLYAECSDDDMKDVRALEQNKAAVVGEYAAMVQLGLPSSVIKNRKGAYGGDAVGSISALIDMARPEIVYTHNLADKHDTHVAVALRVIEAIKRLPADSRPKKLYGMEVWRGLDWVTDDVKTVFDASDHPNIASSLMGVYDSQIMGGKRYDLAVLGRRKANATFFESHGVDKVTEASYGIDMSPLISDSEVDPASLVRELIDSFANEVSARVARMS